MADNNNKRDSRTILHRVNLTCSKSLFVPEVQYHISTYVGLYMILSRPSSNHPTSNSPHYLSHQEDAMARLLQMWSSFSPLMAAFIESPNSFLHDLLTQQQRPALSLKNKHKTGSNHILSTFPRIGWLNLVDYSKSLFSNSANLISQVTTSSTFPDVASLSGGSSGAAGGFLHEQLRFKISPRQHQYILDNNLIHFSSSSSSSIQVSQEAGLFTLLAKPNLILFDHTPQSPFLVECKHSNCHILFHQRIRQFSDQISSAPTSETQFDRQESSLYLCALPSQQDVESSIAQSPSDQVDYSLEGHYIRKPFSFSNLLRLHSYLQANFFEYELMADDSSDLSGMSPNLMTLGDDSLVMSPSIGSTGAYIPSVLYREINDNSKTEEGHLFSQFGTKFKETLENLKEKGIRLTQGKKDLTPEDLEDMEAMKQFGQKPPMQNALDFSKCLSAAMNAPAYVLFRDENQRRGIPIILSMIKLKIVESDDTVVSFTSYTTFKIELEYNTIKWTIFRRTIDFVKLHMILSLRHYQGHLPKLPSFPSHISYFLELRYNRHLRARRDKNLNKLMLAAAARRKALQDYLLEVLYAVHMHITTEMFEFLEISVHSLLPRIGWKGKEGYLRKKVTEDVGPSYLPWCMLYTYSTFESQWFIIRPSYVAWSSSPDRYLLTDVMLVDKGFRITFEEDSGMKLDASKLETYSMLESTGAADSVFPISTSLISRKLPKIVTLRNAASQVIVLKPSGDYQLFYWIQDLQKLLYNDSAPSDLGRRSSVSSILNQGEYSRIQQFDSFAPVRPMQHVEFFVDGHSFFRSVANALLSAKRQIFLSGWWISPELYLERPNNLYPEYRLDKLLQRVAAKGVMIYVLIYKEVPISLPIDSAYTKITLESLHPNIRVQRHPDHLPGGVLYWAHHEKLVIIDQRIAYLGGLDLCYGRYDTPEHRLSDRLVSKQNPHELSKAPFYVSSDRMDDHIARLNSAQYSDVPADEEGAQPREVINSSRIISVMDSSSASTIADSVMEIPIIDHLPSDFAGVLPRSQSTPQLLSSQEQTSTVSPNAADDGRKKSISRAESTLNTLTWLGLDYSNPRLRDFRNVRQPNLDILDRKIHPRMPWHDIHMCIFTKPHRSGVPHGSSMANSNGNSAMLGADSITSDLKESPSVNLYNSYASSCARDLARHFISKWNFVKREKAMHKPIKIPFLVPDEGELSDQEETFPEFQGNTAKPKDKRVPTHSPQNTPETQHSRKNSEEISHMMTAQVLRSAGTWSLGLSITEQSIQDAYIQLIRSSKHYIYVENQFFITRILIEEDIGHSKSNTMKHHDSRHGNHHANPNGDLPAFEPLKCNQNQMKRSSDSGLSYGSNPPNSTIDTPKDKSTTEDEKIPPPVSHSTGNLPPSSNIPSTSFENLVGNALYDRILLAHRRQEVFRVIIVLPLLPAFENDVSESTASSVRILLQAQLLSIRKGRGILDALERAGVPIDNYILFLALRKFENTSTSVPIPKLDSALLHPSHSKASPLIPTSVDPIHLNEKSTRENSPGTQSPFPPTPNIDNLHVANDNDINECSAPEKAIEETQIVDSNQVSLDNVNSSNTQVNLTADPIAAQKSEEPVNENHFPNNIPLNIQEQYLTEQIYVHSKVIIVDDMYAVLGSANINDRSLVGYKDGEIGIYLSEENTNTKGPMNGKSVAVGPGIRNLRIKLWKEHLGIVDDSIGHSPVNHGLSSLNSHFSISNPLTVSHIEDPIIDACFYGVLKEVATRNTEIYRQVFHCLPDDSVRNWKQYREFSEKKSKKKEALPSEVVPIETMGTVYQQPPLHSIHSVLESTSDSLQSFNLKAVQSTSDSNPLVDQQPETIPEDQGIDSQDELKSKLSHNTSEEFSKENDQATRSKFMKPADHPNPPEHHQSSTDPHSATSPSNPLSITPFHPYHKYDPLMFVQGHLVLYPTFFLAEEDLGATLLSPEWILPNDLYY